MSSPVENLVFHLQAKRSGKGWRAKCPAHEDHTPSLSINEGADGCALIKCHAGCDTESILAAVGMTQRDLFPAKHLQPTTNGSTAPTSIPLKLKRKNEQRFDWQACVEAFTQRYLERLAQWRGYSIEFCSWLKQNGLVGLYDCCIAFPVHENGKVVGAHYRPRHGDEWFYSPNTKARPLVIGELVAGDTIHVFESQWDAFAFMNVSGERHGIIITRGSGNGKFIDGLDPAKSTVYAWKQNDKINLQSGKCAGDEWIKAVAEHACAKVLWPRTPEQFKDLNDWTRAGATVDDLLAAMI